MQRTLATWSAAVLAAVAALAAQPLAAERVKDLASLAGVRSNPLVGYGLVVGLDGSGDQTSQVPFATQSLKSMLTQFGISVPANVNPQLKNVAAVAVHADLPPFARPGQTIDITVSSIGNAKSLRGGALLLTPLRGADGEVYAIAQGNLIVGGLSASGEDGSSVTVNIPSAGRVPNGATVERAAPSAFVFGDTLQLQLHSQDFTTASRLVASIDARFGIGTAVALDSATVRVRVPPVASEQVRFVAEVETLQVDPGEGPARVIVNARTGTVVIGSHVRVMPAAVSHGSITVTIAEETRVSQPEPFARRGSTVVTPGSEVAVAEQRDRMFLFGPGTTLSEIVSAVNQVGAGPGDVVAILQALRQAGALRAELTVI